MLCQSAQLPAQHRRLNVTHHASLASWAQLVNRKQMLRADSQLLQQHRMALALVLHRMSMEYMPTCAQSCDCVSMQGLRMVCTKLLPCCMLLE